jgi:hypothetical protein
MQEMLTQEILNLLDDLHGKVGIARMLFMNLRHQLKNNKAW